MLGTGLYVASVAGVVLPSIISNLKRSRWEFTSLLNSQAICGFMLVALALSRVSFSIFARLLFNSTKRSCGPSTPRFERTTMIPERLEGDVNKFFWPTHHIDAHLSHKRVVKDGIRGADLSEKAPLREMMVVSLAQLTTGLWFPLPLLRA